ncbi:MAG: acylneuraminate cytidylyltransferase family protein [Litorivicinaceae bacterium]|nr:acylneuraminate cytidylyltransferase family protein [Litorivicinaceae bacterium]
MNIVLGLVYAIIPARSGSKGVPDKNIRVLGNFPLISYSIKAALKAKSISRVIVSTDSKRYSDIACSYGAETPFLRPRKISGDRSTDNEFFEHAIDWFNQNEGVVPEYFVHLRPTTPLRSPRVIDDAVECFLASSNTALRSAHLMPESAYKAFEIRENMLIRLCGAGTNLDASNLGRQMYPETYKANGYVDVVRTELILKNRKIHGDNVLAFITNQSYEIDEASDIEYLEFLLTKNQITVKELFKDD